MRYILAIGLALTSGAAHADGFYAGAMGSFGKITDTHATSGDIETTKPYWGAFAGYTFDLDGWEISPEARLRGNMGWHAVFDNYTDLHGGPGDYMRNRYLVRETITPSAGIMVGRRFGAFKPYVGVTAGVTNMEKKMSFRAPLISVTSQFDDHVRHYSFHAGVELDAGNTFVRVEAEHRTINGESHDNWKQFFVSGGVGVRF